MVIPEPMRGRASWGCMQLGCNLTRLLALRQQDLGLRTWRDRFHQVRRHQRAGKEAKQSRHHALCVSSAKSNVTRVTQPVPIALDIKRAVFILPQQIRNGRRR